MLREHRLSSPQEKRQWLDQFQPNKDTFVVSDLTSKLQLQGHFLEKIGHLPDTAILRASELWRRLLTENLPEWRVVSMDLVRILIQQQIESGDVHWARGPSAAHSLTQMMPQFLPLLAQEQDLVREWLLEHPDSLLRWGHWYALAQSIWGRLQEEKMIPGSWIPALLCAQAEGEINWPGRLIFDLSAHMTSPEYQLAQRLARVAEDGVELLIPEPTWASAFADTLRVYKCGEQKLSKLKTAAELKCNLPLELRHFSTPLAEVKDAVAQLRVWLDQGVNLDAMAVVAPDIEVYWPLIAPQLKEEGIPVAKPRTSPLHTFAPVQSWLSHLRWRLGRFQSMDLELATFERAEVPVSYERFKQLFTHLYDSTQVERETWVQNQFLESFRAEERLNRDEFIVRACASWRDPELKWLEKIVKQMCEDCPPGQSFSARLWVSWLEAWAGKIEEVFQDAESGLVCTNLQSAEWLNPTHVYFLGASEESLRESQASGLSASEVGQIERDLGLFIPMPERGSLEFEARWLFDKPFQSFIFSCAKMDALGGPETPSRLWMIHSSDIKAQIDRIQSPQVNRWDEIQHAPLEEIARQRHWPVDQIKALLHALHQDQGFAELESFGGGLLKRLSVSRLESYTKCPFIYAAQNVFHLSDLAAYDLDLDRMTSGKMVHALFERLTVEPRRWDYSDGELENIIEDCHRRMDVPDLGLWPQLRRRFLDLAKRFLEFEKNWRETFPKTRTVARELKFNAAWSMAQKHLVSPESAQEGDPLFSGVIDRVDQAGDEVVILDYKSSVLNKKSAAKWIEDDQLQLPIYIEAVESGLTDLAQVSVRGAFYYDAKDFKRDKGLKIIGDNELLPDKRSKSSDLTAEEWLKLSGALHNRLQEVIDKIRDGEFAPAPKDIDDCAKCQWRSLCRAPHLQ